MPQPFQETDHRIETPKYSRVSRATESLILKLSENNKTQQEIAAIVGVSQATVSRTLSEFADTRHIAKALLHNGASVLAKRVIENANVEESLEVLDRLDVAAKRQESKGTSISIEVCMPGQGTRHPPVIDLSPTPVKALSESTKNP